MVGVGSWESGLASDEVRRGLEAGEDIFFYFFQEHLETRPSPLSFQTEMKFLFTFFITSSSPTCNNIVRVLLAL